MSAVEAYEINGCALYPASACTANNCLWRGSVGEARMTVKTEKISQTYSMTNQALYNYWKDVDEGRRVFSKTDLDGIQTTNSDLYRISGTVNAPWGEGRLPCSIPITPLVPDSIQSRISFTCGDTTLWLYTRWLSREKEDVFTHKKTRMSTRFLTVETFQLDQGGKHDQSDCVLTEVPIISKQRSLEELRELYSTQ